MKRRNKINKIINWVWFGCVYMCMFVCVCACLCGCMSMCLSHLNSPARNIYKDAESKAQSPLPMLDSLPSGVTIDETAFSP